jgi:hypothetical protein
VIDPGIPDTDRALLRRLRTGELTPRSSPPPSMTDRRLIGSPLAPSGFKPAAAARVAVCGGALGVLGLIGWLGTRFTAEASSGAFGMVAGGAGVLLLSGTLVHLITLVVTGARWREPDRPRAARMYHGRYLIPAEDLDSEALDLMARTQTAIDTVMYAEVGKLGLVDTAAEAIALPYQEWDIAQALYDQTIQRARHARAAPHARARTRRIRAPQRRALREATAAVTRRVEALEAYAREVQRADEVYLDCLQALELAGHNEDFRELLARTVADEQATAEIEQRSGDVRRATQALREILTRVSHAAEPLALSSKSMLT